jgi:serine/threonine protein kinase
MAVDEKRVQEIFLMAVDAEDFAHRVALLDRECGPDAELRQRVEALLAAYQGPSTIVERLVLPPGEAPPSPSGGTEAMEGSTGREGPSGATPTRDAVTAQGGPPAEEGQVALQFLQPTAKPGSLGRLGHYEVLEVLGRGSFGIVVRAFDEVLQRVVAIKVMSPELASTSPARKRFLREARAAGRVRHENVVQIYAVEEQPLPYLVMEYIPGRTLQQRLDRSGPLDVPDVLRIGGQIARGLAAAHEQGLIHRDIKPSNILLEGPLEEKVKITDFGLARAADDASGSQSGVIAGTPQYMAPEQARGETLDHRVDLFSLGSVLYTVTSGRPPFRAATALAVLKRVAEDTPRPIPEIIPETPQWLCALIARLHAKDPARRFQSAAEVADLLGRHLAHLQQPSLVPRPKTLEVPRPARPRRVAILAAAAVVLAVLGAVLTYPLWRRAGPAAVVPAPSSPGGGQAPPAAAGPAQPPSSHVLQGRPAVRGALIDFSQPEHNFSDAAQDNAVRRAAEQCNPFLVRFDLARLGVPPKARVVKAVVSFYVWDPSSSGRTKVCAFPLKTAWDEATVTWRQPAAGKSWQGGEGFAFGADAGPPGPGVVVEPDQGSDTVDPPIEYQLDVTDPVRSWLDGGAPNHGLAIAPVIDPSVDEGFLTRFQMYGPEHGRAQYTPKLTVQVQP